MKRPLIILFLCCCSILCAKAQTISQEQFQKLITYLNEEDWAKSAELSKAYLASIPKEKQEESSAPILRYMSIVANAGLMNERKITQKQAIAAVSKYQGHTIVFPWRTISDKFGSNFIGLQNDKSDTLRATAANKANTMIFAFEHYIPKVKLSIADYNKLTGKQCRMYGKLSSIAVEGNILPRFRIIVDDAEFNTADQ